MVPRAHSAQAWHSSLSKLVAKSELSGAGACGWLLAWANAGSSVVCGKASLAVAVGEVGVVGSGSNDDDDADGNLLLCLSSPTCVCFVWVARSARGAKCDRFP